MTRVDSTPVDVVVMAAGKGTRMKSRVPKVLQRLAGVPLVPEPLPEPSVGGMPYGVAIALATWLMGGEVRILPSFTGAVANHRGLFQAADGGTLFLDEVGDMDLTLQAKLLKIIEDGRFRRIGAVQEQQVYVRIVAATNRDLQARVDEGAFRADLYFRLRVLQLSVPPLRERENDASYLAQQFCQQLGQRYRREGIHLGPQAQAAIAAHRWPGNVRELRNVIEQAVLLAASDAIEAHELMLPAPRGAPMPVDASSGAEAGSALDRSERELLIKALAESNHNVSQAARILGISRDTLRYRLEKHALKM